MHANTYDVGMGGEDVHGALSLEVIFHEKALHLVALLLKET